MVELGEIEWLEPRIAWPDEARDFTPWLANNLSLLGDEIGLELEHRQNEAPAGNRSLDFLAYDGRRDSLCAIENQLEPGDNDHMARLLQYAASYDAHTVIWVASGFRSEHLDTVNWLNRHTSDDVTFYCVEIRSVKIDDSRPAALFRCVARPITRAAAQWPGRSSLRKRDEQAIQFFQPLLDELQKAGWRKRGDEFNGWYQDFDTGFEGITFGAGWGETEKYIQLWISRGSHEASNQVFDTLQAEKAEIEAALGLHDDPSISIQWERRGKNTWAYMLVGKKFWADVGEVGEAEHDEIRGWMKEYLLKFKEVFTPRLQKIVATEQADSD